MSKSYRLLAPAFAAAAFVLLFAFHQIAAQSVTTGTWTASADPAKPGKVELQLERGSASTGRSNIGHTYDLSELQGLAWEQATGTGSVRFSLVREAGRIDCEGSFRNGKGSGTFTYTTSQSFVSAMKARGFDFEKVDASKREREHEPGDRLFAAAALNVTTALADDLLSAGFNNLDAEDLIKATIFKVDSQFAREMRQSGFENLGMEDLVKARIFHVDAEFARQAAQMGFDKQPLENLVKMRIFKVTPEFIAEARGEGLTSLSLEDLVKLRIFKIDAAFIREARAEGVPVEVESLVQKKIGVRRRSR
jgi:hypothetical protein